ncbi:hypothetical protein A1O1_07177 [Capronia coronata CBS 617.96]|uniref:Zn(2)-C6 fungal-type domain-containing protein n=1 Tax=Capronia coronata CBS 617.96 TaxID=1182541 RepID=W9YMQ8_9EURO|nr:uncharacterized protein A1O1_07177 [Capronia coronata CBS 617.96]EXJ83554.1 hypothetical protein A1O1_07177 [Capronia coronata CBS 617.96]
MFRFGVSHQENEAPPSPLGRSKTSSLMTIKRQITRNRTSYSCVTCRRRKVKCDKVHPVCGGCRKINEQCSYSLDDAASIHAPASLVDGENNAEIKKRKISPPHEAPTASSSISGSSDAASPAQLKAIEEQLFRLTTMIDALRQDADDGLQSQLQELLMPTTSSSDRSPYQRRGLSLDMFKQKIQGPSEDSSDLSRPLSGMKLSNGVQATDDPLWNHISNELDQLNQSMREGRASEYVSPASVQDTRCPPGCTEIAHGHAVAEKDDFWEPTSFHKEASRDFVRCCDPDSTCPVCQTMPFSKSVLLQGIPVRFSPASARHHLLRNLPTRAQSNVLFRCWLSGVYPIMPIINPALLLEGNEALWTYLEAHPSPDSDYPDLEVLGLLYAIWYAAALSISSKGLQRWFPGTTRAKLASGFHDQVVFGLQLGSFTRNITLPKLAALILITSMPVAEEDPIQNSLYMQLAVRLASSMGLHREPTLFDVPKSEEGTRRRLWWQVVQMDVSLVVASGFPSLISEAFCDTNIICEDSDPVLDVDEPQGVHPAQGQGVPSSNDEPEERKRIPSQRTLKLVGRARSVMACALRSVVSIHLGTKMLTNVDMQEMKRVMQESGQEVDTIISQIPARGLPELGFVPDGLKEGQRTLDCDQMMTSPISQKETAYYKTNTSDDELSSPVARYYRPKLAAYNKWARISLSMLKDKLYCVAYGPFLKNAKSKLWNVGRQCALHNSHSFMRKFISLATDPDLEPFRWTWPAMHGPLHAAMISLVDLYERPDSVEAPRSRELIDGIFSLSAPELGIVGGPNGVTAQRPMREGGLEAWDMLRALRSAAWQRAGLDPTVLWTGQDQLQIGLAKPLTGEQRIAQSLREDTVYEAPQPSKDNTAEITATENSARYVVRMAQSEMVHPEAQDGLRCTRTRRNQFLKDIENEVHRGSNRGLVRREGQQAMPFPLSGRLAQCSRNLASTDLPTDHVLELRSHCPKAGDHAFHSSDRVDGDETAHQNGGLISSETDDQVSREGLSISEHRANVDKESHNEVNGTIENGLPPANGLSNGYGNHFSHDKVGGKQVVQTELDSGLHHDNLANTNGELGFDWERWDSVFGQYSGFTDLMEDVTWTDYVDE